MRTLLTIAIALWCALAQGQSIAIPGGSVQWNKNTSSSGPTNIVTDVWEDFEFVAAGGGVTSALLEAHDHYAPTSVWSVTDASLVLSTSATGEQHTINSPQGTADSGTLGLAYNTTGGAVAFCRFTFTAANTVSCSCWFFATALSADAENETVMGILDASSNIRAAWHYRRDTGNVPGFRPQVTSGVQTQVNEPAGAWYWLELTYVQNGACTFAIYNASGSLLSSQTFTDTSNVTVSRVQVGPFSFHSADSVNLYWDDVLVNLSGSTPLGP